MSVVLKCGVCARRICSHKYSIGSVVQHTALYSLFSLFGVILLVWSVREKCLDLKSTVSTARLGLRLVYVSLEGLSPYPILIGLALCTKAVTRLSLSDKLSL